MKSALVSIVLVLLLAACGGTPPPADWKMNAVSLLEHAQLRWLEGDSKTSDLALNKARLEIAKSGRIDLLARAELAACAAQVASLDFSGCKTFDKLAIDANTSDQTYARFLAGDWSSLDAKLLPAHYANLIGARDNAGANHAVADMQDPLPRLIAAALLFHSGRADPTTLGIAVDTASERGWRRPLLAWLAVQLRRAQASNDSGAAQHLQRRIDLVIGQIRTP